jgi:hypothetical protein
VQHDVCVNYRHPAIFRKFYKSHAGGEARNFCEMALSSILPAPSQKVFDREDDDRELAFRHR